MKNKGFVLTETLVVSVVVLTALVLVYVQFSKINNNYSDSYLFDNVNQLYALKQISTFVNEENVADMYKDVVNYLDITSCYSKYYNSQEYCEMLYEEAEIESLLFTYNNKEAIYGEISRNNPYGVKMQKFIKTINDSDQDKYPYRLIAKFYDGSYASIPFGHNDIIINLPVTINAEHLKSDNPKEVLKGQKYETTFTADPFLYNYPDVIMGDNKLSQGTDYTFDDKTGHLVVNTVTSPLTINFKFYSPLGGATVYFNPETGKLCNDYSASNNNTGCMKWYIYDTENLDPITMILDHNTTTTCVWSRIGGANSSNPVEAQDEFDTATSTWTGVSSKRFPNYGDSVGISGGDDNYPDIIQFNSESNPVWFRFLIDNTKGCKSYGCDNENTITNGYWMNAEFSSDLAWCFKNNGSTTRCNKENMAGDLIGVRPVISIPESVFP